MNTSVTYQTGWPGVVNVRVNAESLKGEMIRIRQAAYTDWNLDLPATDMFNERPYTTGFLPREQGRAVGTIPTAVGNLSRGVFTPTCKHFGLVIAESVGTESFADVSRLAVLCSDARAFQITV